MITIELKLSASLLCILKDINKAGVETCTLQVEKGTTIRQILLMQGISPMLAPMITIDNQKVGLDAVVGADQCVTIFGPLAGG